MNPRSCKLLCLAALGLTCCTESTNGSATVNGSILGRTLTVKTSLSYTTRLSSATAGSTTVVLGSYADGCALGPHTNPKSSQALVFVFAEASGGGTQPVTHPAEFAVGATPVAGSATVTFVGNDNQCVVTSADSGTSGSVTLTQVSDSEIDGSFDVTLASGAHITGSFHSPNCGADDLVQTSSDGSSSSSCQ
jgi:hypothetical protein